MKRVPPFHSVKPHLKGELSIHPYPESVLQGLLLAYTLSNIYPISLKLSHSAMCNILYMTFWPRTLAASELYLTL